MINDWSSRKRVEERKKKEGRKKRENKYKNKYRGSDG